MRLVAAICLLIPVVARAESLSAYADLQQDAPAAWAALTAAQTYCDVETDGGELEIGPRGVVFTDLDGDGAAGAWGGPDDVVVDFNDILCSRAMSLWAGTGGSPVHFVLDGTEAAAWFGFDWEVERMGAHLPAVILLARHGSACDGAGAAPCVQAMVASEGVFWTLRFPEEWAGFPAD